MNLVWEFFKWEGEGFEGKISFQTPLFNSLKLESFGGGVEGSGSTYI
jgi:hypothetical protein